MFLYWCLSALQRRQRTTITWAQVRDLIFAHGDKYLYLLRYLADGVIRMKLYTHNLMHFNNGSAVAVLFV